MVTVIGAGLSGMAVAYRLHQQGIPVTVLEANSVAGGRIQPALTERNTHQDLGPSWVWPYAQPVVEMWLNELELNTYPQFDDGDGLIDRHPQQAAVPQFLPGQHGMLRISGGTHAIINRLLSTLKDNIHLSKTVTACYRTNDRFLLDVTVNGVTTQVETDHLIMATPPRVAIPILQTPGDADNPSLQAELANVLEVLQQTPTWMAPQAKVVILYKTAFWRDQGLSGRVASQVGPLVEIHDHSGPDGSPAALFGFVGVPAAHRADKKKLSAAIEQQLTRCFGHDAPVPTKIIIKDWAVEKFITTDADLAGPGNHPSVINELARKGWCNNKLWFTASETSSVSPGLIEGALARADEVAKQVIDSL